MNTDNHAELRRSLQPKPETLQASTSNLCHHVTKFVSNPKCIDIKLCILRATLTKTLYDLDELLAKRKPRLLITASTYPQSLNDAKPRFIYDLAVRLKTDYDVFVLAPSTPTSRTLSRLNGINCIRHRYFIKAYETLADKNAIIENIRANKANILLIPLFIISQIVVQSYLIRRLKIDIVNAHWVIPQGVTANLSRKLTLRNQTKLLITCHGGDVFGLQKANILKTWALNNADHVIVVSKTLKNYCRYHLKVKHPERISIIPMGVDLQNIFTTPTKKIIREGAIFVGRLAEKKGVATLIEALDILKKDGQRIKVTIVGDGNLRASLEQQSRDYGIDSTTRFIGHVNHTDLPTLLQQHLLFIFPSIITESGDREGLGLSLIEGIGCECLAISSNLATTEDIIEDGKTGLLFTADNAKSLASTISNALHDTVNSNQIQKDGRRYALNNFDWSIVATKYVLELETLIQNFRQ